MPATYRQSLREHVVRVGRWRSWLDFPATTRRSPNVGSMLVRRLRHRPNIEPTSGERPVFARYLHSVLQTAIAQIKRLHAKHQDTLILCGDSLHSN